MKPAAPAGCGDCRHFGNSAAAVEQALPGLVSLGSAYAAVRADDGICRVHQRYVSASSICASHAAVHSSRATSTRQS